MIVHVTFIVTDRYYFFCVWDNVIIHSTAAYKYKHMLPNSNDFYCIVFTFVFSHSRKNSKYVDS